VVAGGGVVSAHIATVPTATPGFRMEIYGRNGALHVSTPGAVQRDANKLSGAKGRAALAPMEVPAAYAEAPPDTPPGPPQNVAALYRRLGKAVTGATSAEPDFEHAVLRHTLMDTILESAAR
jgi:predicted dehydrogenase